MEIGTYFTSCLNLIFTILGNIRTKLINITIGGVPIWNILIAIIIAKLLINFIVQRQGSGISGRSERNTTNESN